MLGDEDMPDISSLGTGDFLPMLKDIIKKKSKFGPAVMIRVTKISMGRPILKKTDKKEKTGSLPNNVKDYYSWLRKIDMNEFIKCANDVNLISLIDGSNLEAKIATLYT